MMEDEYSAFLDGRVKGQGEREELRGIDDESGLLTWDFLLLLTAFLMRSLGFGIAFFGILK